METGLDLFQLVALHPDRRRALDSMDGNRKTIIFKLQQYFLFVARACLDCILAGLSCYLRVSGPLGNVRQLCTLITAPLSESHVCLAETRIAS